MKEIRSYGQLTSKEESRSVEGYASLFNSTSVDLGGFTECIAEGAFDGVIGRSTVLALLNHDESRGILARSVNGEGSLHLEVDERGLKFSFDAPHTPLGDELLEMLKRGDVNTCSFAFTVAEDSWKKEEGQYRRTINKIGQLYDISPVYDAAYPETSIAVAQRSLDKFKETEVEEVEEEVVEENTEVVEEVNDENIISVENTEEVVENTEENTDTNEVIEEPKDIRKHNNITMEKFSLIKTVRAIVNNQSIDEVNQAILDLGKEEMRKSGCAYSGQIQLPVEERGTVQATVTGAGEEVVETEKLNILEPLRNRLVLTELGANYMTGLVGNISIPNYSGTTCTWEDEIDPAQDGAGTFGHTDYEPHRLTAYIDISKQFLNQDAVGAEAMLRQDIVNAIADKLEATVLGAGAGSSKQPAGIFNGAGAATLTFAGLVGMEQTLETANIPGEYKFVVSPAMKATLKTTAVGGTKSDLRMLLENGEANGYKVVSTGNSAGIALANWSDLIIAQFGAIDIVVDPYTVAKNGCIRLVVNAYFDAKFRRNTSVVAGV